MAAREFLALNESTPQVLAPQSGDTYVANRAVAFNIGTITANIPILDLSATWNNAAVAFQGLRLDVIDNASAAASDLLELRSAGSSIFGVRRADFAGTKFNRAVLDVTQYTYVAAPTGGFFAFGVNESTVNVAINIGDGGGLDLSVSSPIRWNNNTSVPSGSADLALWRDAANILAQRNGRTAQRFRVYNDFNGSSDGEWFDIDWQTAANVCTIGPRANGTGFVRDTNWLGSIGIGTPSPQRKLHIRDTTNAFLRISSTLTTADFGLELFESTTWRASWYWDATADVMQMTTASSSLAFCMQGSGGRVGIGVTAPTAKLHLPAGTATANTAPLKLTSGTNLTTPENGAFEFDGTNLYFTSGGTRKTITMV